MKEVDPKSTSRALAFELWMKAPMPMVTLMKTLDVTPLVRMSRKKGYKFNMLLCWCIGKAAEQTKDFYLLPVGDNSGGRSFPSAHQKCPTGIWRARKHALGIMRESL